MTNSLSKSLAVPSEVCGRRIRRQRWFLVPNVCLGVPLADTVAVLPAWHKLQTVGNLRPGCLPRSILKRALLLVDAGLVSQLRVHVHKLLPRQLQARFQQSMALVALSAGCRT